MNRFFLLLMAAAAAFTLPLDAQEKKANIQVGPPKRKVLPAKDVTPDEAEKLIAQKKDLIVLDVRMPEEFDHEHIKGAVNAYVYDPDFQKLVGVLDQSKPVLIHCASGGRSRLALQELGPTTKFTEVYHLRDGLIAWKKAGKPLETKLLPREVKPAEPNTEPKPEAK